ncbi:MAG: hypothetical protein IPJ84_14545 [Bdellovibrionales bacterium]|nr:hypothetical protein [Bdellovibrionales bacterium]
MGAIDFVQSGRWKELQGVLAKRTTPLLSITSSSKLLPRLPESLGLARTVPVTFETLIFESVWSGRLSPDEANRLFSARGALNESEKEQARTALLEFAQIRFS